MRRLRPLERRRFRTLSAVLGCHAHEESVRALAAPAVWLESYAHDRIPLGRQKNGGET